MKIIKNDFSEHFGMKLEINIKREFRCQTYPWTSNMLNKKSRKTRIYWDIMKITTQHNKIMTCTNIIKSYFKTANFKNYF
jgi:hypothetical protein